MGCAPHPHPPTAQRSAAACFVSPTTRFSFGARAQSQPNASTTLILDTLRYRFGVLIPGSPVLDTTEANAWASRAFLVEDSGGEIDTVLGGWRVVRDSILLDWYDAFTSSKYAFVVTDTSLEGIALGTTDELECNAAMALCTFARWERALHARRVRCS